jgi:hypothetical protein
VNEKNHETILKFDIYFYDLLNRKYKIDLELCKIKYLILELKKIEEKFN